MYLVYWAAIISVFSFYICSSYLHCEWRTADELELGDRRVPAKIRRFRQKKSMQSDYVLQVQVVGDC